MGTINLKNNGRLSGDVKDVFESQKGCLQVEVEDLFSEALGGRPEPTSGQKSGEAGFGSNDNDCSSHSASCVSELFYIARTGLRPLSDLT